MPETTQAVPAVAAPVAVDEGRDISKQGRMLLRIRVNRPTQSNETVVEMQSDFDFQTLFQESTSGDSRMFSMGGIKCVCSRNFSLPSGRQILFNIDEFKPGSGRPANFSFFMAQNLATGVKFKFTNRPLSVEAAKEFISNMKELAKEVLSAYLRPVDEGYKVVVEPFPR